MGIIIIETGDIDDIYSAIGDLSLNVSNSYGPIVFDIEGHYISEKKAVEALRCFTQGIGQEIIQLKAIQQKYKPRQCAHYPVDTCLQYHQEIFESLNEVLSSDEIREFESPGLIDRSMNRIQEIEFKMFWHKRRWRYLIHLFAFFPFLAFVCWLIISKEDKVFKGFPIYVILILTAVITILFNLFFNNHSSFKDSWQLILSGSRKRLKDKLKKDFLENWTIE